jgi:hypothetical protein
MKIPRILALLFTLSALLLSISAVAVAQKSETSVAVPQYDPATEARFIGMVEEVKDRQCPVSGGVGSHLLLKLSPSSTIEVHLATTKFVKGYDLVFKKGEVVRVVGSKVRFEGAETIFARELNRGGSTYVFREKDGTPIW